MKISKISGSTRLYMLNNRKVRVHINHYGAPHLYLVNRDIDLKNITSKGIKPDWENRPDLDTYNFVKLPFDFLVPSYCPPVKDKETGELRQIKGVRGTRAFMSTKEAYEKALVDFNDNYEIWKKRQLREANLNDNIVAKHVTECLIYDEKEWQRDPPKFAEQEVDGVKKRVMLDPGTTPQPLARGLSACSLKDQFIRKVGVKKARGRAFSHYKHKFGTSRLLDLGITSESVEVLNENIKKAFEGKSEEEILALLDGIGGSK
jgi:hypothetical protein